MKFALTGNPNSGKTTLFNALTGSTAHVGNWPGVTVDKKSGYYKKLAEKAEIIDLPGIYSLSPYSPEEIVARKFSMEEKPDCIINIVDATNLERNLYLTTQLLELDVPIVVALNMSDAVRKRGDYIDIARLEKALNVPVVEISALKRTGIKNLMEIAYNAALSERKGFTVLESGLLGSLIREIRPLCREKKIDNEVFHTIKMIEGDSLEVEHHPEIAAIAEKLKEGIDTGDFNGDYEGIVADARYRHIVSEYAPCLKKSAKNELTTSDKIDRVLTHKIWGIPMFLLIMLTVFHLTFSENLLMLGIFIPEGSFDIPILGTDAINSPGVMLFSAMEKLTELLTGLASGAMPAGTWYTGLIVDGLLSGLFSVLSFIPQIITLFFFLAILEDTGYMARAAFIMDRAFRRFGLTGKAFMPMLMCFGCAVPGIMATRTLESEQERKRTILVAPFFSCGAKLPIWAAFAGVFSQAFTALNAELVVYSMYVLGIAIAILSLIIFNKVKKQYEVSAFIMELPAYHLPQARNLAMHLWDKLKHYIFKAATVIAGAIVVIWFLSTFNFSFRMVEDSGDSILGIIAKGLTWLFVPLGFGMGADGWKFVVAAFTGLIAKEMVVATLGTFSGIDGSEALDMEGSDLADTQLGAMMLGIGGTLGGISVAIPAMFAFMAFNLLSVPCMAAVAAASGELRSKKSLLGAIGYWLGTAYLVSLVIFWSGVLITYKWWIALIVALGIAGIITAAVLIKKKVRSKRFGSDIQSV